MERWYKINNFTNGLIKVIYLNLLWCFFIIIGLGIFGLFPATSAMFAVMREWMINGEQEIKIFQVFKQNYLKDFFLLNAIALLYYAAFYLLFILTEYLNPLVFVIVFILFGLIILTSLTFLFPVYVHFKLKNFDYLKQAFLIALFSPSELFAMILTVVLISLLTYVLPGVFMFFNGSLLALSFIYFSRLAFEKL